MGKITIQDISKVLIERNGLGKKEAATFANAMFDIIQQALERDRIVKVKGLGTFKIIDVDARESVNVNTGERVLIEGHDKITFVPDALMKELVNKPFSQFETVVLKDGVDFEDVEETPDVPLVEFGESINLKPVILGEEKSIEIPIENPIDESPVEKLVGDPPVEKLVEDPVMDPVEETVDELEPEEKMEPVKPISEEPILEEPISETIVSEEPVPDNPASDEPVSEDLVPEESLSADPTGTEEPYEEETEEESPVYAWEEESSDNKKWWIALAACLVGLIGGYLLGSYYPLSKFTSQNDILLVYPDSVKKPDVALEVLDTLEDVLEPVKDSEEPGDVDGASEPESETLEVQKPEPSKSQENQAGPKYEVDPAKYDAMDVRIRTGAYMIIGTERVVKVKEGENLGKIARRVLGPDMECYLEAYNGMNASAELKVGQEIKIPKLLLKKKKKPQTVNE